MGHMFETGGGALPENFYTSKEKIRNRKGKIFKIQNHKNPILCVCVGGGGKPIVVSLSLFISLSSPPSITCFQKSRGQFPDNFFFCVNLRKLSATRK